MTPETANIVFTDFFRQICLKLDLAVQMAKAAEACIEAGNPAKAVEILMDIEDPMFQTTTLLNGASLLEPTEDE